MQAFVTIGLLVTSIIAPLQNSLVYGYGDNDKKRASTGPIIYNANLNNVPVSSGSGQQSKHSSSYDSWEGELTLLSQTRENVAFICLNRDAMCSKCSKECLGYGRDSSSSSDTSSSRGYDDENSYYNSWLDGIQKWSKNDLTDDSEYYTNEWDPLDDDDYSYDSLELNNF